MKKILILAVIALGVVSCASKKTAVSNTETPSQWKRHTNIYEVNVRQYTDEGTFKAFSSSLPRLKAMGVETLWFMPITPVAELNKKGSLGSPYAAQDYTSVNPQLGTLKDFRQMVDQAHRMGFKVIIDWVANHTGWDHVWTKTHPEFYVKDADGSFHRASGMDDIIELDYTNPQMRRAMIDAMKYWVRETGIDGFRCDLASWVEVDFWKEARPEVEKIRPLFWLGEFDELENPEYGKVFDASYTWTWMHKTKDYAEGKVSLQELRSLLQRYSSIGGSSQRAWFTTNHDENTWNGTEYEKYGVLAKPLAVFSATWDGVPLVYSGQELPNKKRLEFFEKDPIQWNGTFAEEDFYRTLFSLKSFNPALRGGDPAADTSMVLTGADDKVLAYLRENGNNKVLVVLNMSKDAMQFSLNDTRIGGSYKDAFTGKWRDFSQDKGFSMQPGGYAVFVR